MEPDVMCILARFQRAEKENQARVAAVRRQLAEAQAATGEAQDARRRALADRQHLEVVRSEIDWLEAEQEMLETKEKAIAEALDEEEVELMRVNEEVSASRQAWATEIESGTEAWSTEATDLQPEGAVERGLAAMLHGQREDEARVRAQLEEVEGRRRRLREGVRAVADARETLRRLEEGHEAGKRRVSAAAAECVRMDAVEEALARQLEDEATAAAREVAGMNDRIKLLKRIRLEEARKRRRKRAAKRNATEDNFDDGVQIVEKE